MARYCPSIHRLDDEVEESQLTLVGLIRSGLLKRFESSAYAFGLTAGRMADSHDAFLKALDAGYILSPKALEEWTSIDSDEEWERLLEESGAEPTDKYDVEALRAAVEADRDILRRFADTAAKVKADNDPKLAELTAALAEILHAAEKDGIGEEDTRDKRKIIIFSYFADTADWIEAACPQAGGRPKEVRSLPGADRLGGGAGKPRRRFPRRCRLRVRAGFQRRPSRPQRRPL